MAQFDSLHVQELIIGNPSGQHTKLTGTGWEFRAGLGPRQTRVYLHLDAGFPELSFFDANGTERLKLCIYPDGTPRIELLDANGHGRLACGVLDEGVSHLSFYNGEGQCQMELEAEADGTPNLILYAKESKRFELSLDYSDQAPYLQAFDADGKETTLLEGKKEA